MENIPMPIANGPLRFAVIDSVGYLHAVFSTYEQANNHCESDWFDSGAKIVDLDLDRVMFVKGEGMI